MRIRNLAIAALIAAAPTATAFAQSALDQSVPRVSPTTPSPPDTSGNSMRWRRERGTATAPPPRPAPMSLETQDQFILPTRGRPVGPPAKVRALCMSRRKRRSAILQLRKALRHSQSKWP